MYVVEALLTFSDKSFLKVAGCFCVFLSYEDCILGSVFGRPNEGARLGIIIGKPLG